MKWFRSLAAASSLAVGLTVLPFNANPAYADGLVNPSGKLTVKPGQVLLVGQLFQLTASGVQVVGTVKVGLQGGLAFPDGSSFRVAPNLQEILSLPFVATSSGFLSINVTGTILGKGPFTDTATADVNVIPTVATNAPTTQATATIALPTAPPTPAPVTPTPSPVTPIAGNRPPVALGRSVVARKNSATSMTLKGTDPEGSPLVYALVDVPDNGLLTGSAPNLTYTPSRGFTGTDAFTFTVSDGVSTSEPAAVSVTVKSSVPVARKVAKGPKKKR